MQATLLSIAIALILALVAALVGPHFVDWNKYRSEFEAQAGRMTGLQVSLAGPIEARLLPTPSVSLQRIDIRRPGDVGSLRARRLSIEFSLGSLVRGEWKATDVRLDGAEIAVALDRDGRLEWPAPAMGFDPDSISIERLDIRESRALLADDASGSGIVLDQLEFRGELRTLAGPVKGQGSFYLAGQHYPYRITASRVGDGRARVRFNVDPINRPITADADGFVSIDNGAPHFSGNVTFARPVTRAPAGAQAEIVEPWRLTGKVDGNSKRAVIEQVDFQYGPDERPIRLRGDASVTFGASPRFTGVLSSPQVDLDRILALPEQQRRRPLAAIKAFADHFAGSQRLPIPVDLGITIESLTLAGATIQRFGGEFSSDEHGWKIERLEARAPGLTQAALAGRLGIGADGISFVGRTKVDSKDPRLLVAWLIDRSDAPVITASSLSIDGNVRLGRDEIAVDQLKAALDRMTVEGRLAYAWGRGDRPPRIEAVVSAPDIDLDRAYGVMQGLFDGTVFDWPREGLVSARIGRATLAGVEAMQAHANMRFNAQGLEVERLAIGDFGGAALTVKGSIDTRTRIPRGALTLDLDARRLDGLTALVERMSPQAAAELRRNAGRIAPVKLNVSLNVGSGTAGAGAASAGASSGSFKIAGTAGAFVVKVQGEAGVDTGKLTLANLARLGSATIDVGGEIESRDGGALVELLRLERLVAVASGGGRMSVTARGGLEGDLAVDGRLAAGGLDVSAKGTVRLAGNQGPTAGMDLSIARASLRAPRLSGRPAEDLPATLTARLSLAEGVVGLADIAGKVAGTDIGGRVTVGFAEPVSLGGELTLGAAALPAAVAAAIGVPRSSGSGTWPAEPFEQGLIGNIDGAIKLRVGRLAVTPLVTIEGMRGALRFGPASFAIDGIDGAVAGGRVAGAMSFERGSDGLSVNSHIRLAGVSLAEILPGDGALAGRATVDLDVSGTGRSPVALIGALKGEGTFTIQDGRILRTDPSAFDAVIRSVDDGLPIDMSRIRQRMETALNAGALSVSLAQGEIAVAAGQARLANTAVRAKGAELAVRASLDLTAGAIDARLVLAGMAGTDGPEGTRPEIALAVRGPVSAPARTLDVAAFTNWLALRAIEEKDKRIDALQSGREVPVPPAAPIAPAEPPPVAPARPAAPTVARPAPEKATPPESSQPPKTPRVPPRLPAAKAAPPTDIRPPAAAKAQTPPRQQAQQPVPPRPPAPRSWLENLFGP